MTVIIDDNRNLSDNIAKLVKELTGEWGWQMRKGYEMIGAEADRVVYIGCGKLEAVSRARLSLGILLCCCKTEQSWMLYYHVIRGYRAAIEQGLVLVATLPSNPQVASNVEFSS